MIYRSLNVLSPVSLLLLWELLSRTDVLDSRFFPPPSQVSLTFIDLTFGGGGLLGDLGVSLARILGGFLLGAVPALVLGLAMGLLRPVRAALDPLISFVYPVPKLAILPLLILILGLGEASKLAVIAIGVFFQVLINTVAGVLNIPALYFDAARNLGANRWAMYRTVALPGALPTIFAGLKIAMGTAFLLIVAAEFVAAQSGIGYRVWNSWRTFDLGVMYSGLILLAVTGLVAQLLLATIQSIFVPWQRPDRL
ncbi:MAG: ABC transporter permease subunit [Propionibacteriales bacterium]|nr:ABC transporter permease subunit [Propionibacteriales bacterium]